MAHRLCAAMMIVGVRHAQPYGLCSEQFNN